MRDAEIYLAESLCEVAQALDGRQALPRAEPVSGFKEMTGPDMADVLARHPAADGRNCRAPNRHPASRGTPAKT